MAFRVIIPPAVEPDLIDMIKRYVREYSPNMDTLINDLIPAVRRACENYQNRAYLTQTVELALDAVPAGAIKLPRPPFHSLESVVFYDTDETVTTVSNDLFAVDSTSEPARIWLKGGEYWPAAVPRAYNPVVIRYVAGATTTSGIPADTRLGIAIAVNEALDKGPEAELSKAVKSWLEPDRVIPV